LEACVEFDGSDSRLSRTADGYCGDTTEKFPL